MTTVNTFQDIKLKGIQSSVSFTEYQLTIALPKKLQKQLPDAKKTKEEILSKTGLNQAEKIKR